MENLQLLTQKMAPQYCKGEKASGKFQV